MLNELTGTISTMFRIFRKRLGVLLLTIIFISTLGILEMNGHSFVSIIRYIFGNKEELNFVMILAKVFFVIVYASFGYSSMVFLYESLATDSITKVRVVISRTIRKYTKVASYIILLYVAISVIFEYFYYIILKTFNYASYAEGYTISSVMLLCKHAIIFLFAAIVIYWRLSVREKIKLLQKILLSKVTLFFLIIFVLLTIIIVPIISKTIISVLQIDKTLLPYYLNFVQAHKYRVCLSNVCRIYEAIISPLVFLCFSLEYNKIKSNL